MKIKLGVFLRSDGKIVRIKTPLEDPIKIPRRDKATVKKQKVYFSKSKLKLPEVISMWKNPHATLIPIEKRVEQRNVAVNVAYFAELQRRLEEAEESMRHEYRGERPSDEDTPGQH